MKKNIIALLVMAPILTPTAIYAHTTTNTSTKRQMADSVITAKIKTKFIFDKALKSSTIAVFTHKGVVTLKGVVNSDTQYKQAIELAQSADGVKDVETNGLSVKDSVTPLKDIAITAKINGKILKQKLFSDKEIQYSPISIETQNGVVYLKGKVKSEEVAKNILNIVKNTEGVKGFMNLLKVSN
jgi:hyperosmotically inducible protein